MTTEKFWKIGEYYDAVCKSYILRSVDGKVEDFGTVHTLFER